MGMGPCRGLGPSPGTKARWTSCAGKHASWRRHTQSSDSTAAAFARTWTAIRHRDHGTSRPGDALPRRLTVPAGRRGSGGYGLRVVLSAAGMTAGRSVLWRAWLWREQCPRASPIAHEEDRSAEASWSLSPRRRPPFTTTLFIAAPVRDFSWTGAVPVHPRCGICFRYDPCSAGLRQRSGRGAAQHPARPRQSVVRARLRLEDSGAGGRASTARDGTPSDRSAHAAAGELSHRRRAHTRSGANGPLTPRPGSSTQAA